MPLPPRLEMRKSNDDDDKNGNGMVVSYDTASCLVDVLWSASGKTGKYSYGSPHYGYRYEVIAVLEVGLGGRLDATNVVEPIVSVITDIGIDHTEFLGSTITEIAGEKAGILRSGKPAIVSDPVPPKSVLDL